MIDVKYLRENPELVKEAIINKNEKGNIDLILENDQKRRDIIYEVENLKRQRNENSAKVAQFKKEKKDTSELIATTKEISIKIKEIDVQIQKIEKVTFDELSRIPNIPHKTTPIGKDESFNETVGEWGEKPSFTFKVKDHLELGELHDILDFKRGGKISGSGFAVYKGKGAQLERALINFMLDLHIEKHGYTEILPPFVVNRDSMFGTGQLPKMEDDMYLATKDDLFLIPTAEVPVTNLHRNETIPESELPIKYVAYSACFRREAGSYGKDTRGFQRVHQFNKVEMVNFVHPDESVEFHEQMLREATEILELLDLPYRILLLCSGDISFAAGKCYDIETWSAADNKWLETSSISSFDSFQARRSNIRFKPAQGGKTEFLHTLNGSGLATSRLMVSLLEHYQNEDGSISIPEVLHPYLRGTKKIG
jgi:seryl-tRNA synthetase